MPQGMQWRSSITRKGIDMGSIGRGENILSAGYNVPDEYDIRFGNAIYGGLPVKYDARLKADAENLTFEIHVSDKFFEHPENIQRHILNHEVAHNLSDKMIESNASRFTEFSSAFLTEKEVPKTSQAYKNGQRSYFEGIYGDMGSNAIHESATRAITEYLENPTRLKQRSEKAYREVRKFMKGN